MKGKKVMTRMCRQSDEDRHKQKGRKEENERGRQTNKQKIEEKNKLKKKLLYLLN